jgi:polysaccharide biosynthesis transport protein
MVEPLVARADGTRGTPNGSRVGLQSEELDAFKTQCDLLQSQTVAAQVIAELGLSTKVLSEARTRRVIETASRHPSHFKSISEHANWESTLAERKAAVERSIISTSPVSRDVIAAYLQRLLVRPKLGTTLITIFFSSPDPVLSANIIKAHERAFIDQELELRQQANRNAQTRVGQEVVRLKAALERAEDVLHQYRREHGLASLSPEQSGPQLRRRINELNRDLSDATAKRISLEGSHRLILDDEYESLPEVSRNSLVQSLKEQTAQFASQYASMSNRFNPGYHPLDDLKAKLDESELRLEHETVRIAEGVEADYRVSLAAEEKLRNELDGVTAHSAALDDTSLRDNFLAQDVERNRRFYDNALERMNDIAMMAGASASAVAVVDEPQPSILPSSPNIPLTLGLGLGIGLLGGLGTALVLELSDDGIKSANEAERFFHVPVIGNVPDFFHDVQKSRKQTVPISVQTLSGQALVGQIDAAGDRSTCEELVTARSIGAAAEAYRTVRTALVFSRAAGSAKTVGFTSSVSGEGKTLTTLNTAVSFAQLGGRTLLIDADLRRPRCHKVLGLENTAGLTEVLLGLVEPARAIRATTIPKLWLLSSGLPPAPNPTDLLSSGEMQRFLAEIRNLFDHVCIDTPPVTPVSDTVALSTFLDGVLLVVAIGTPKAVVREACLRLHSVGANIIGVVLNKTDVTNPDYQYYNGPNYRSSYEYRDRSRTSGSGIDLCRASDVVL